MKIVAIAMLWIWALLQAVMAVLSFTYGHSEVGWVYITSFLGWAGWATCATVVVLTSEDL